MLRFLAEKPWQTGSGAASSAGAGIAPRDAQLRERYLRRALAQIPRLLEAMDRNPFRPTYGCLDRQYWHYRTSAFPSGMYQEGVLALAMVYAYPLPGNPWYGCRRVRELAEAGIHFAARSSHPDGSCDDYYPFERALGAAVFSLVACGRAYELLRLDEPKLLEWLRRRGRWVARHSETGRLTNHHALAALGLAQLARLTQQEVFLHAAQRKLHTVLTWQHPEGWFDEYGGADPGYQTLTIDCLAKLRRLVDCGLAEVWKGWPTQKELLTQALVRAVRFAWWFLHPDASYGGPYGSRGTRLFFPHGMELLADQLPEAADLADGFLRSLESPPRENRPKPETAEMPPCSPNPKPRDSDPSKPDKAESPPGSFCLLDAATYAHLDDDRLIVHWPAHLIEAYRDWSAWRPVGNTRPSPQGTDHPTSEDTEDIFWPGAGLFVRREKYSYTVISTARGGVFVHFPPPPQTKTSLQNPTEAKIFGNQQEIGQHSSRMAKECGEGGVRQWLRLPIADAGLVVETVDGRWAVSSLQDLADSTPTFSVSQDGGVCLTCRRELYWVRWETASPFKQALFYLGMCLVGRFCRTAVRWWLQRRLITGRRKAPIRLTRQIVLRRLTSSSESSEEGMCWQQRPTGYCSAERVFNLQAVPPWIPPPNLSEPGVGRESSEKQEADPPIQAPNPIEIFPERNTPTFDSGWTLRVTDTMELLHPRLQVRRMAYGPEGDWVYVAVGGAYQPSVLASWTDASKLVETLNQTRQVQIVRQWP